MLTREEELEYQVEVLKREPPKKDAEIVKLKKSIKLKRGKSRKIYKLIQAQAVNCSVIELRDLYGISLSGYYKWLSRWNEPNRYEKAQTMQRLATPGRASHPSPSGHDHKDYSNVLE